MPLRLAQVILGSVVRTGGFTAGAVFSSLGG